MDLNSIIRSDNAANIQLVVSAKDLRDLIETAMKFAREEWKKQDEPTYYTREELLEKLHVSDPTLNSYRRKGLIPEPITIEGRVLYDKDAVNKALTDKRIRIKRH